ncbi:DZIP1 [Carabus blaptoides fortunei]
MADSGSTTNLTREQKEFLEECESEFANRFTDADEAYKKVYDRDISTPPIISPWYGRSRHPAARAGQPWDTGFCFDSYKSQKVFDRNGIALLDIERIIRERDIAIVDHHIQNILEYKLDIEETRILDPNFVKLFRLSQLAVEYLTYCKKYLDSTIAIIKQDLQKANEENTELKHDLVNYQSEIHKWRKKVKDLKCTLLVHRKYQPPASCISDGVATFQCNVCSKVFVNDEYLKSHVTRRHSSVELEPKLEPTVNNQYKAETDRLQMEIKELKEKLNSRERYFKNEEEKSKDATEVQSDEYCKRMEKMHDEFEQFKAQYEAEMKVIRKSEQDKLMEKILDKLETNSTKTQIVKEDETIRTTPVQNVEPPAIIVQSKMEENSDDLKCNMAEQIDDTGSVKETNEDVSREAGEIPVEQQRIIDEQPTRAETKMPQKEIRENLADDITKVKEEVGKELGEKTKQDIEKLGEQLSEQMSDTFGLLQSRMETFWHKLQEIEVQRGKEYTHTQVITPPTPKVRTELNAQNTTPSTRASSSNSSTQNSEESETESNCYEPKLVTASRPATIPVQRANELQGAVLTELKTKMREQAAKTQSLQRPNAQKVFAKPLVQKPTVSSAESESTGSDSEETRSESEKVVESVQQARKTSVNAKNTARPKAEVLQQFRQLVEEEFDERQRELGLDPEWARLPDRTYKHKLDVLTHQRMLMEKEIPELSDIREDIIQKYDIQFANTNLPESANPERDITPRHSRFKSLFLNMKNKAKSMIRQERPPTITTGVYKLTIHRDSPEQNLPKPTYKSARRTNKPLMYDSESENASETERKPRKVVQKLRKTKSETNMVADQPVEMTNSVVVRSLSNLDSILEVKEQLSKVQDSGSSEVIAEENCRVENVSSDMESDGFKEERAQKSALKNYPSAVKKKVLFDLHKDEQNAEIHNERSNKQMVDTRFVKSNSLFQHNGDNESSSIDSDILDFHKTEVKKPGSGDTISTKALINVTGKAQDDGSDWDISDIGK